MSYFKSKNSSVSLEWAAMFIGVVVVSVSAYLIFGTDWNAYRVANVLIGIAFITFITYSFTNASSLKRDLNDKSQALHERALENEKLKTAAAELNLVNEKYKIEVEKLESTIAQQAENIEQLIEQVSDLQVSSEVKDYHVYRKPLEATRNSSHHYRSIGHCRVCLFYFYDRWRCLSIDQLDHFIGFPSLCSIQLHQCTQFKGRGG